MPNPNLKLSDLQRGQRFISDYQGTIVEIVEKIPEECYCPDYRGKPGILVYWDFIDNDNDPLYPHVLPERLKTNNPGMNWIPLEQLQQHYGPEAFGPTFLTTNPLKNDEAQTLTAHSLATKINEKIAKVFKECDPEQPWVNISFNAGGKPTTEVITLSNPRP